MGLVTRFLDRGGGALFLLIAGAYVAWMGAEELRLAHADVPSTCAVLASSTRKTKRGPEHVPELRLAHEVEGSRYERLDEGAQVSEADAKRALIPFPEGAAVPCRYVKGRPDLVMALPDRPPGGAFLGVGGGLVLLTVVAYVASRKPRP